MTPNTNTTSGAADRAIENCPELNMGNYDEVDVERLNDWAIRANDEIDRLHALAAGQATAAPAQPVAQQPHRSGCTAGTDEACVQRGCGTNCPAVSPQADSVQEDAARYRLLRRGRYWSVIDGIGNDLLRAEALDAAIDAARKQGGL